MFSAVSVIYLLVTFAFVGYEGHLIRATLTGAEVVTFGTVHPSRVGPAPVFPRGGGNLVCVRGLLEASASPQVNELYTRLDPTGSGTPSPTFVPLRWKIVGRQCYVAGFDGVVQPHFQYAFVSAFPIDAIKFCRPLDVTSTTRQQRETNLGNWKASITRAAKLEPFYFEQWTTEWPECRRTLFDFFVDPDGAVELYIVNSLGRLTRRDYKPGVVGDVVNGAKVPGWVWVKTWGMKWVEPFYVAASGRNRYLVTESGRVFAAKLNAQLGDPLADLWKGSPVRALIYDADSSKSYAFTTREYFEITDPIKPRPHKLTNFRGQTSTEALEVALKCGQLIRSLPASSEPPNKP